MQNTLLEQAKYLNTFDKIRNELKPLNKIYFTVKTDINTYYYESDMQDSLDEDIKNIAREIKIEDCKDIPIGLKLFASITFSTIKPCLN